MRRLVNDSDPRQQPLEILQQKISVFEEPEHAQVHANAGNQPPGLPMQTLHLGNLAAEPEIHAGCRKEQGGKWRVPGAVKNIARYDQQVFSQLPSLKAPVKRDDNREEDKECEGIEKHCDRRLKRKLLGGCFPECKPEMNRIAGIIEMKTHASIPASRR